MDKENEKISDKCDESDIAKVFEGYDSIEEIIKKEKRLLLKVKLKPILGDRFQPTGFPDIGAAYYESGETKMLIVESTQSIANRLESTCWDENKKSIIDQLKGIPYIEVDLEGEFLTSSILEAHRLASPYVLNSKNTEGKLLKDIIKSKFQKKLEIVDQNKLVDILSQYDFNSLLHGVFFADSQISGGKYHLQRALTGFVEAENIKEVILGGVKEDILNPKGELEDTSEDSNKEDTTKNKQSETGRANVIYPRTEYTGDINAYFNLDIEQIKNYNLDYNEKKLLFLLSLFKIKRLLESKLKFRSACDLKYESIESVEPGIKLNSPNLPDEELLLNCMRSLIGDIKKWEGYSPLKLTYRSKNEKK